MLAANYSTVRNNLKDYCDRATDNQEVVIVTRKNDKNVVILSLDRYTYLDKAAANIAYLEKIDRAMGQLARGEGTVHELIEAEDD